MRRHTLPCASAPSLPPSGPPGSTFLPFFLLPFSPLPGPRRAATRSVYGGAGPQAPPPRGDSPGRQAAGVQVEVLSGALGAGVCKSLGGVWLLILCGRTLPEGGGALPHPLAEITLRGWSSGGRAGSVAISSQNRASSRALAGGIKAYARVTSRWQT